ncbi:MAG: Asp-tRNA(Asn)/Glu-tRNA(Gln) amidotransferase subunit GatC [Erysipelotrichaceae bacterium]|nr:Asp-tRNA(Asn)/Glu-tRNA(Gln) amidotransferase subunit GatC [Erysipelotrichaceae bacterium]
MEEVKNPEYFKKLAHQLMFDLSDEEAADIVAEFDTLTSQLALLDGIDTTGVEPMVYPFETPTVFLREDIGDYEITPEEALSNVANSRDGHFVVPKVVK